VERVSFVLVGGILSDVVGSGDLCHHLGDSAALGPGRLIWVHDPRSGRSCAAGACALSAIGEGALERKAT
jgi:hypothetical protein